MQFQKKQSVWGQRHACNGRGTLRQENGVVRTCSGTNMQWHAVEEACFGRGMQWKRHAVLITYSGGIFRSLPQTKKQRVLDPLPLTCLSTRLLILKGPKQCHSLGSKCSENERVPFTPESNPQWFVVSKLWISHDLCY